MLDLSQKERHSRGICIPDIGEEGQIKLMKAKVLIVGVGSIGSIVSQYLTAAGIGKISMIDFDTIDMSDLQHQVLYETSFLNRPKVRSAQAKLQKMNPNIEIDGFFEVLSARNVSMVKDYDFIINTTNNIKTALILNQACVTHKKPFTTAFYHEFVGQIFSYVPGISACLNCALLQYDGLIRKTQNGVLGFTTGVLGSLQSGEVIKYFVYEKDKLNNFMFLDRFGNIDTKTLRSGSIGFKKMNNCPVCKDKE